MVDLVRPWFLRVSEMSDLMGQRFVFDNKIDPFSRDDCPFGLRCMKGRS